jgi:NADH-quinone oxidoreductase subunit K
MVVSIYQIIYDLLITSLYICIIGIFGLFFWARHLIVILISFELILLGLSSLFVFFSILYNDIVGQIISLVLLCIAGADSALGLALFLIIFRNLGSINISSIEKLRH